MQLERSKLQLSFETYSEKASLKCICLLKTYLVNSLFQIIDNHSIQKTSQRTLQNNSKSIYYIQFHYSSRGSTNSMALQAQPNPWHSRLNRLGSTIFTYITCSAKCRQPNLNSQTTTQFVLSIWITHICSFN